MRNSSEPTYELYYWPMLQGRGEFIRLAFEEAAVSYTDVARLPESRGGGIKALEHVLSADAGAFRPFAPPIVKLGPLVVAQTAQILHVFAPRLKLVSDDEQARVWAQQLQLTISDVVTEAHDTHHPVSGDLYYEDQRPEALRRATWFVRDRIPKFLSYFEAVLRDGPEGLPLFSPPAVSYVDLSAFQLLSGLDYAFPKAMQQMSPRIPRLRALQKHVALRPRIAAYLKSTRRLPFNELGIFRHYEALNIDLVAP